jgi:hypothetical protein
LFRDASTLHTSLTDHYTNGSYQRTDYSFLWRNSQGQSCFSIKGTHGSKNKRPPATNLYNFGRAAELAWSRHLLEDALIDLQKHGWYQFNLKGEDWVRVGPGWADFHLSGHTNRCGKDDVGQVIMGNGRLTIKRRDARIGWFNSSGVFEFRYSDMANAHLFILLFHHFVTPLRL